MTTSSHQLLVGSDLHETCAVEHDDTIGHADGREAVRHEDRDRAAIAGVGAVPIDLLSPSRVDRGTRVGSSRCPIPGRRTHASVSRS